MRIANARMEKAALRRSLVSIALVVVGWMAHAERASAGGPIGILVLKEHGVGNQALAQPYLDRFAELAARRNGWPGAKGKYVTNRPAAETFIEDENPHYAILSLPAFLAMREPHHLEVIGKVEVSLVGGRRYHVISKSAKKLEGCKGKTLASDHADDPRFIDRVVAGGDFTLADFHLLATQRPLQTIKAVATDQADCALVDDAQVAQLEHLEGVDGIESVWKSDELPPMPVVAFPAVAEPERKTFQKSLESLCDDEAKAACAEVGIEDLKACDVKPYAEVVAAYGK